MISIIIIIIDYQQLQRISYRKDWFDTLHVLARQFNDTNNYESSVYQTPELNPSFQQTQTLENNHDSNQDRVPPKQLEYQDTNGQDENVLNSSESEESQQNEYFDFEQ